MKLPIRDYQIIQNFLSTLGNRKDFARAAFDQKNSLEYKELTLALNKLQKGFPQIENMIFGYIWPKCVEELGKCNGYFFQPKSIENEIKWLLFQLKRYKSKISQFVILRNAVEKEILLGNYDLALELLEDSVSQLGVSIWYYETKILILSYQDKAESLIHMISDINQRKKESKTGFVPFLLSYIYKRSFKNLSAYDYDMDLYSKFKRNITKFQEDRYNYYLFRLNYYQYYNINDLAPILVMESTNSLIDRYITLLLVLKSLFTREDVDKEAIVQTATTIYRLTNDRQLTPFLAYSQSSLKDDYYHDSFIKILDTYYTGKYYETTNLCRSYIASDPSNFDVIKLYCRALLFLRNGFSPLTQNANSIVNQMAQLVFTVMNGGEVKNDIYRLYQLNKNLYGLSIGCTLDSYIKEERNEPINSSLKLLSIYQFDPYFSHIYDSDENKLAYLDSGDEHIKQSVVIEYQKQRVNNIVTEEKQVVGYIREVDNAKILYNQQKYNDCINLLSSVLEDNKDCIPIAQSAVKYMFNSYISLENYSKAISYYVNTFIQNKAFVSKVDTKDFSKILKRKKYKNIRYSIDLLIFVFMNAEEDTDKSYVLETYCRYKNVKAASELFELFEYENRAKIEELLRCLVTDDILRHTTYISSTKAILDEQQKIIQYLIGMDSPCRIEYEEMAQQLMDEMIVYEGMTKVDESKIYANIQAVVKYELKDSMHLYNQFQTQYELSGGTTLVFLVDNTPEIKNESVADPSYMGKHVRFTDNALKEISYQLYSSISNQFLKSKFGLGTYLSTRIRHGVFEGEIQCGLIEHNLLLNTENDIYIPNKYWQRIYGLSDTTNSSLMKALENFSKGVNTAISSFKSDVLQIRLADNEKGFFDYRLSDEEICLNVLRAYNKSKDFDIFCYALMMTMWEVTERNLTEIRRNIREDFTNTFHNLLDKLQTDVCPLQNYNLQNDLSLSINDARTDIGQRLARIEGWFHIQDSKFEDFDFENQLFVVWNITAKMYPSVDCELNRIGNLSKMMIDGSYCIHISDLLRIFFTNMIKHSKKEAKHIFLLKIEMKETIMHLHFENNVEGDEERLNKYFHELLNSYDRLQKEGGSGLVKARKIVKYDLGCEENEVNIKVEKGKCLADIIIKMSTLVK